MAVDLPQARTGLDFAPKYGQHTRSVLAEAGLSEREIAALFDAGVAS